MLLFYDNVSINYIFIRFKLGSRNLLFLQKPNRNHQPCLGNEQAAFRLKYSRPVSREAQVTTRLGPNGPFGLLVESCGLLIRVNDATAVEPRRPGHSRAQLCCKRRRRGALAAPPGGCCHRRRRWEPPQQSREAGDRFSLTRVTGPTIGSGGARRTAPATERRPCSAATPSAATASSLSSPTLPPIR